MCAVCLPGALTTTCVPYPLHMGYGALECTAVPMRHEGRLLALHSTRLPACLPAAPGGLASPHSRLNLAGPLAVTPRREPEPSPGPIPTHLIEPLVRSFNRDHYVADSGNIVFYQEDPNIKADAFKNGL